MKESFAFRIPWPRDFPNVLTHCTVKQRDQHPAYKKAKTGDHKAAIELAKDLLDNTVLEKLKTLTAKQNPVLIPVGAIEREGYNAIPPAMAAEIGSRLSMVVDVSNFYQTNRVEHTRAPTWQRIVTPPLFKGKVQEKENYILVDDHTGVGGTLANLRGYIETNNGKVVAMTTLTASREAEKISLTENAYSMLISKYGEELEQFWKQNFGYGLDCLTAIEFRTINRQPSFDAIRDFIFKAANEANSRGTQPITVFNGQVDST